MEIPRWGMAIELSCLLRRLMTPQSCNKSLPPLLYKNNYSIPEGEPPT